MQFDPALKELLLRRSGSTTGVGMGPAESDEEVAVLVRLRDPRAEVRGLRTVTRMGRIMTGRVTLGELTRIRADPSVASLKASRLVLPALDVSVPGIFGASAAIGFDRSEVAETGRGVVVGVLDWGVDFAHANFRNPDGTSRLVALWDQRGGETARSPAPYGYGREFDTAAIDAALAKEDPYAALDYDPAIGAPLDGSHGTHVLDIAAGNGRAPGASPGVAPGADLVFVHLRGNDTQAIDTLGDSVRLLEALRYVSDCAGSRPLVINMSLGTHGGPHDGSTLVEMAIDAFVTERPGRVCVMSTGNYFRSETHAAGVLTTGAEQDLLWEVTELGPPDPELEVWYPGADTLSVELFDPDGESVATAELGEDRVVRSEGEIVCSLYHRRHDPNNGDNQINVFLWPQARPGLWTVRLRGESMATGRWHAWIERAPPGLQSRFAAGVVPTTTTGTICNGRLSVAVGAFDATSGTLLPFSSAGPTRDERQKPNISAPGVGIRAARSSRLVGDVRVMDDLVVKSGTSMAAPHVTGAVALMFEAAGGNLDVDDVRDLLFATARTVETDDPVEKIRFGVGMLDARAAVERARARVGEASASPDIEYSESASVEQPLAPAPESLIRLLSWADGVPVSPAEARRAWQVASGSAPATYLRHSARDLTEAESARLIGAFGALAERRAWGRFVYLYRVVTLAIHRFAAAGRVPPGDVERASMRFLPWHRLFVWKLEQELRSEAGDVAIPYWSWSDPDRRSVPPAWRSFAPAVRLPEPGDPALDALRARLAGLDMVPVAGGLPPLPSDDEVQNGVQVVRAPVGVLATGEPVRANGSAWSLPGQKDIETLMAESTYERFSERIQRLDVAVHLWISGGEGTMSSTASAPADPLFWLHHAEIDRLWWQWQQLNPDAVPPVLSPELPPWPDTIAGILDPRERLGYAYATAEVFNLEEEPFVA